MKWFFREKNPDQDFNNNIDVTNKTNTDLVLKDQNNFNTGVETQSDPEFLQQTLLLPSRALFYKDIPYQIVVRDLSSGEVLRLQSIRNIIKNMLANSQNEIINNILATINKYNLDVRLEQRELSFLERLKRVLQLHNLSIDFESELISEYFYLHPDLINVFQNCILTPNVNLRDLTIDDFIFIVVHILFMSNPDGFSYKYDFDRYNIKGCDFSIKSEDLATISIDKLNNTTIKNHSKLLKEWEKNGFTPPLVKHVELFVANCYRESLTPEQNNQFGLWDKDTSLLYYYGGQYIKGRNVEEQLEKIRGSYRKKHKILASLSVFRVFYEKYVKINYSLTKAVSLSSCDYDNLSTLVDGLKLYKDKLNLEYQEKRITKEVLQKEIKDCDKEIENIMKIKSNCKTVAEEKSISNPYRSREIKIQVDLDIPRLVSQIRI